MTNHLTYFRFHLLFNLPPLLVLLFLGAGAPWHPGEAVALGWVLLAVLLFTTPWDNFAAKRGIWGFPREKYSFRLGYLPVEEYLFFLWQSLNVMLAVRAGFRYLPRWHTYQQSSFTRVTLVLLGLSLLAWLAMIVPLRRLRQKTGPRLNYTLHLVWFLPVLYLQWVMAPPVFTAHAAMLGWITAGFGIYYTLADLVAVRAGLWFFDEKQITGARLPGGLPWEESAFFFLTSLLVAQSYLLLLPAGSR